MTPETLWRAEVSADEMAIYLTLGRESAMTEQTYYGRFSMQLPEGYEEYRTYCRVAIHP